ncbi:MAG: T9SS type A sorting domain-containing protein [Bacteroidetes bacterium]|nr:T9SS type A sorting domain-containing protein [Bacteroidota bacterium]
MKKTLLLATLALSINAFAQQWTVKTPAPTMRSGCGASVVNNIIYVIGGWNGSNIVGTVEAYNPATDTWSTKTPMPTLRGELGVASVNGKIYAIGGYNGSALNTVEEYDPIANTWAAKTSMPTARSIISVGVINDTIYVVGGWPGGKNTLEAYIPSTDTWVTKASIAVGKMQNNGCAVLNNKMYYIGGKNAANTIWYNTNEAYNPITDTWTTYANLPQALWNGSATVLNNEIHYMGGTDAAYLPNYTNHFVYNSSTDSWSSNALSMLHKRSAHIAATVNGKIYVIGGSDSTNAVVNWNEEYNPGICYVYITVTDTLIINANLTGYNPVTYANTIKIYPNPTNDHITIDYGNYTSLAGYTLKIMNTLSQTVFTTAISASTSYVDLSTWSGNGVYFVHLIDPQSNTVDIRKIVLQ